MTNVLQERLDDCISTLLKYPNLFGAEINQYGKKPVWQIRAISGDIFDAVELTLGIPTTYYEVKRIFTDDEVPSLLDFYKLQQEWMEKFGPDWVMEREYLDEAISELLEKRPDLTN